MIFFTPPNPTIANCNLKLRHPVYRTNEPSLATRRNITETCYADRLYQALNHYLTHWSVIPSGDCWYSHAEGEEKIDTPLKQKLVTSARRYSYQHSRQSLEVRSTGNPMAPPLYIRIRNIVFYMFILLVRFSLTTLFTGRDMGLLRPRPVYFILPFNVTV